MEILRSLLRSIPGVLEMKNGLEYYRSLFKGTYSQHGEDIFILERMGSTGFYVDVGANDPFRISNTYGLYRAGWRGITIEPIRKLVRRHQRIRPADRQFNVGVGAENMPSLTFVEMDPHGLSTFDLDTAAAYQRGGLAKEVARYELPIRTLTSIIDEVHPISSVIDLLSIDVEGLEVSVLQGIDFNKYRPRIIIVESNSPIGEHAGSRQVKEILYDASYRLLQTLGANQVYELA